METKEQTPGVSRIPVSSNPLKALRVRYPGTAVPVLRWAARMKKKFAKELDMELWSTRLRVYSYPDSLASQCGMCVSIAARNYNHERIVAVVLNHYHHSAEILVTFNDQQKDIAELYRQHGFKQRTKWRRNPNSGHDVCLFSFTVPQSWRVQPKAVGF